MHFIYCTLFNYTAFFSPLLSSVLPLSFGQDSNTGSGCLGEMFENRDAVFVLSYSIMMLNTDLHNEQNKKKMTLNVSGKEPMLM